MQRAVFDLLAEPEGDLYRDLVGFAVRECETVLLVLHKSPPLTEYGKRVMRQLQRFLRGSVESRTWPGTELGTASPPALVLRYSFSPECAQILKDATDRLFGWTQPELPEDLCLLRDDGSEWLVTLVHDHDSYMCLSPDEKAVLVEALPQVASRLRDARCREAASALERPVMQSLVGWDPYGYYGGMPEDDAGVEARAIIHALSSREVQTEGELAAYIADMYDRWYGMYDSFNSGDCAGIAHMIWAWWQQHQSAGT